MSQFFVVFIDLLYCLYFFPFLIFSRAYDAGPLPFP